MTWEERIRDVESALLETAGPVRSVRVEAAPLRKSWRGWKAGERTFRLMGLFDEDGILSERRDVRERRLYARDDRGRTSAEYRLGPGGEVLARTLYRFDGPGSQPDGEIVEVDGAEPEEWTWENDPRGRWRTARSGARSRAEAFDGQGRLTETHRHDGTRDLITRLRTEDDGRRLIAETTDDEGRFMGRVVWIRNETGLPVEYRADDASGRAVRREFYEYGARDGQNWLERTTLAAAGTRGDNPVPVEVLYRAVNYRVDAAGPEDGDDRRGLLAFEDGLYEGEIRQGRPEGDGRFRYNDGSHLEGRFENGLARGTGEFRWADGRVYRGGFDGGRLSGRGTLTWPNGDRYEGAFREGAMHGEGLFTWSNGDRFRGLFENGERTDQGLFERAADRDGT